MSYQYSADSAKVEGDEGGEVTETIDDDNFSLTHFTQSL